MERVCNFEIKFTTLKIFAIQDLTYQGTTYGACTQAGSENGAAWCATEVLRLFLSVFVFYLHLYIFVFVFVF